MSQPKVKLKDLLEEKYNLEVPVVFATGIQILVRLCLAQAHLDATNGIHTAGYVTGYRGSPLGAIDAQFEAAKKKLLPNRIQFEPCLNEDLAATALWGTQQAELHGEGAYDGVFGLWYGKGPGVDRSGDALRHANLSGTSEMGGVLAAFGDDHTCESSTTSHQSEYAFVDAMIPVLNPSNIQELFDYGLMGWAMSRYAGTWVGLKCVKDNVESTASVNVGISDFSPILPEKDKSLSIRRGDTPQEQEKRLHNEKIPAAQAFARANRLDRQVWPKGEETKIGIVSTGNSYSDTLQALSELNLTQANAPGLAIYKVGMVWPLEPKGIEEFAEGLDLVIVVEEKRGLIEDQIRSILFNKPRNPIIVGKRDEDGMTLFQSAGALDPLDIARQISKRMTTHLGQEFEEPLKWMDVEAFDTNISDVRRTPYFCAGCPHSTSTNLPEGARGYAGIGCHFLSQFMDRRVEGYTHMGGEGANWIGESKFSTRKHMFQNIGDGTYNHSGILAIRAAADAGVTMTYKILNNDAVALTGGQALEGGLNSVDILNEVLAAGAIRAVLVSDNPSRHTGKLAPPKGVDVFHRDDLNKVQTELSRIEGLTVIVYDQTCAAENRRRRKRGTLVDPKRRVFINKDVCEGCGDCGVQSNCVAILPDETADGRKRKIDQSACNKDFSCLKGFCPSFVTVEGGELRRPTVEAVDISKLPENNTDLNRVFSIVLTGIGGTGVVTVGAVIGMAAHIENKGCGIIDMAGLAQKGGAVVSHIKLAPKPNDISTIRVSGGDADLVLACDSLILADPTVARTIRRGKTGVIINSHETMTGAFLRDRDFKLPTDDIVHRFIDAAATDKGHAVNSSQLATALMGNSIAGNMFLLGFAHQNGLIPLSVASISAAIKVNGVAIAMNQASFDWGRMAAHDLDFVINAANATQTNEVTETLPAKIERRAASLSKYQNEAYAARYLNLTTRLTAKDQEINGTASQLSEIVALVAYRIMAYKDEYEVARLHSDGQFDKAISDQFTGDFKLNYHMVPPILSRVDRNTGRPKKRAFGPWMRHVFKILARLKPLRGTWADPFGKSVERRRERSMIGEYEEIVDHIIATLTADSSVAAVALAGLAGEIKGFGPVKMAAFELYDEALPKARADYDQAVSNITEIQQESA
ncbi:MAG: indolepyruvate ferredoxin oxidoreductase family protein [Paracoccaceae bacterium]